MSANNNSYMLSHQVSYALPSLNSKMRRNQWNCHCRKVLKFFVSWQFGGKTNIYFNDIFAGRFVVLVLSAPIRWNLLYVEKVKAFWVEDVFWRFSIFLLNKTCSSILYLKGICVDYNSVCIFKHKTVAHHEQLYELSTQQLTDTLNKHKNCLSFHSLFLQQNMCGRGNLKMVR